MKYNILKFMIIDLAGLIPAKKDIDPADLESVLAFFVNDLGDDGLHYGQQGGADEQTIVRAAFP